MNYLTRRLGLRFVLFTFLGLAISLLRVPLTEGNSLPLPMVWGDGDSWADTNSSWTYDAGETISPVAMVSVDYGSGKGRVVGFSNGDTISNYCLYESGVDNLNLGINIVDWLAEANGNGQQVLFDRHTYDYYWEVRKNKNGKFKGDFSKFPKKLKQEGYQVDVLDYRDYGSGKDPVPITSAHLQGYDVFVMPTPMTYFADSELIAIQQFVDGGGSLFIFTTLTEVVKKNGPYLPPGEGANLQVIESSNEVAKLFDFRWNVDAINDLNHYSEGDDLPDHPDINQPLFAASRGSFADHPLTEGIAQFGTYELVPSITVIPEPTTLFLLGTGLLILGRYRRIRFIHTPSR